MRVPFGSSKMSARSCGQNSPSWLPSGVTFTFCALAASAHPIAASPAAAILAVVAFIIFPPAGGGKSLARIPNARVRIAPMEYGRSIRNLWELAGDATILNHGSFGACPKEVLAEQ